jgi:hypothetical protein
MYLVVLPYFSSFLDRRFCLNADFACFQSVGYNLKLLRCLILSRLCFLICQISGLDLDPQNGHPDWNSVGSSKSFHTNFVIVKWILPPVGFCHILLSTLVKQGFCCTEFNKTRDHPKVLRVDLIYWVWSKSGEKCRKQGQGSLKPFGKVWLSLHRF